MARFAQVEATAEGPNGTIMLITEATQEWVDVQPDPGSWQNIDAWPSIGVGYIWVDPDWVRPPSMQQATHQTVVSWAQWVGLFTDAEWKWIKDKRLEDTAAGHQMDKMLDQLLRTDEVDVLATGMDPFYDFLVAQGIPGGQTRVDELREGVLLAPAP